MNQVGLRSRLISAVSTRLELPLSARRYLCHPDRHPSRICACALDFQWLASAALASIAAPAPNDWVGKALLRGDGRVIRVESVGAVARSGGGPFAPRSVLLRLEESGPGARAMYREVYFTGDARAEENRTVVIAIAPASLTWALTWMFLSHERFAVCTLHAANAPLALSARPLRYRQLATAPTDFTPYNPPILICLTHKNIRT